MGEWKPEHLGPVYAEQFRDASVAAAYHTRPPYPEEVFDILEKLMPGQARRVLELGCGTGDLTLKLARRIDRLDAVDFSATMLAAGRRRPGADVPGLYWHNMPAESFESTNSYDLVCAGQSLHWMDWPVIFERVRGYLHTHGSLAIVERRVLPRPWEKAIYDLIAAYSTNQAFEPYDLIEELVARRLFRQLGCQETQPVPFRQSLENYVESYHSRNGFSRQRMNAESAARFDAAVRKIAAPWCPEGIVSGQVVGSVTWGRPL